MANSNVFHPGRENVHPLFDPVKFAPDIDYDRAFYPSAYACNKGIGELDKTDIRYVERERLHLAERVRFQVADLQDGVNAECRAMEARDGVRGCDSLIIISRHAYDAVLKRNQTPEALVRARFNITSLMLHELAHAAHFHLFDRHHEDYRETSRVAEAGFEFESRIFGRVAEFVPAHLGLDPNHSASWKIWQSHQALDRCYDLDFIARNAWQLPESNRFVPIGTDFLVKLFDDQFWEGEYLERGAPALIPDEFADFCRDGLHRSSTLYRAIPPSIKDLFREGGQSYAQKKYARFANPERRLRTQVDIDDCRKPILRDGKKLH